MRRTLIIIIMNFAKAGSDELDYFKEQVELYFGRKLVVPEDQQKSKNVIVINEHLFTDDKKYLEGIKPDGCSLVYVSVDDNQVMYKSDPWADLCIDESGLINEP